MNLFKFYKIDKLISQISKVKSPYMLNSFKEEKVILNINNSFDF